MQFAVPAGTEPRELMDNNDTLFAHHRFSAVAAERQDAIAVEQDSDRISYAELERRANRLAHHLRASGVGPGSVVMTCLDRSIDLVVSLLATMKAGGAYLPVEPAVPRHRLTTFAKESGAEVVLTHTEHIAAFPRLPALTVSVGKQEFDEYPSEPPEAGLEPGDPAYVVYTSGSTGTPKGVRVDHASLGYLCRRINARYEIGPADRVLQFAAVSFDTAIEQIFVALLNGATLVLPGYSWAPSELAGRLVRHDVTVMDLTPPYWRAFLTELARTPVDLPVRLTIVGGSAVHAEDCRTALRLMPGSRLVNAYGLTETTITSCTMDITADVLPGRGPAPVGLPLPGTEIHVLDENLRPAAEGEIHIGGPGVAHGYLTEEAPGRARFRPDPGGPSKRLYRTGDRGRWTTAGYLEVTGRVDRQLKIRGFRVEPGEIEATLASHELVEDVAVKPYTHRGEQQVAAYYTGSEGAVTELRAYIAEYLPAYMVPATFVRLPEMPVKTNGKVDLDALPDVVHGAATRNRPDSGAGLIERAVAGLWQQVLERDDVHPDDNFFELGGDSILAAELLAKLRATLGILITQVRPLIRLLLEDATLASFAKAVEAARAGTLGADARPVDFEAEAELRVTIPDSPSQPANWQQPEHILLTGATGFLGIYLLRELLARTSATVHCLVRADSPEHARKRLQDNASHYFDDDLSTFEGRVVAIPGDLAEPALGLSEEDFDRLARIVDVIHHPGGLVNFIYPYSHLRAANVEGTREIVRLASRYRNAPVHYISTMAVISGFGTAGIREVGEQTPLAFADHLSVGYVESKWVAEKLLQNAAEAGLPVAIYRAADISGDRERGAWNTATEMCAMKKFVVDTGLAPVAELPLDYTPVDCYAAAVAHIASGKLPGGDVYHLTNAGKVNISMLVERLRAHGHEIREVAWDEWLERLVATAIEQPRHPMTPFAPLFIDRCATGAMSVAEMYLETTFPVFSQDNVVAALEGSGIEIPPVDAPMLDRYIRYLTSVDFL